MFVCVVVLLSIVSQWGEWTTWSACSTTCGRGQRIRVRQCVGRGVCEGSASQMDECSRPCEKGVCDCVSVCERCEYVCECVTVFEGC